jgi:hypothetical protein
MIMALQLDDTGATVGYYRTEDMATLALQDWPPDQLDVLPPGSDVWAEEEADAESPGGKRTKIHVRRGPPTP